MLIGRIGILFFNFSRRGTLQLDFQGGARTEAQIELDFDTPIGNPAQWTFHMSNGANTNGGGLYYTNFNLEP